MLLSHRVDRHTLCSLLSRPTVVTPFTSRISIVQADSSPFQRVQVLDEEEQGLDSVATDGGDREETVGTHRKTDANNDAVRQ